MLKVSNTKQSGKFAETEWYKKFIDSWLDRGVFRTLWSAEAAR